jgi:hypothetical protein
MSAYLYLPPTQSLFPLCKTTNMTQWSWCTSSEAPHDALKTLAPPGSDGDYHSMASEPRSPALQGRTWRHEEKEDAEVRERSQYLYFHKQVNFRGRPRRWLHWLARGVVTAICMQVGSAVLCLRSRTTPVETRSRSVPKDMVRWHEKHIACHLYVFVISDLT